MSKKNILLIGTYDTKDPELAFLSQTIRDQGGEPLTMDVSVLGDPKHPTDISKYQVAAAGGMSIDDVIALGSEHKAFQVMTEGAVKLTRQLFEDGKVDALLSLGGTMGTDLALDCAQALPLGIPKYVISTVAFSPLIPPNRLAADIQMILWAGGLYGMNKFCRSSLSQAAGAVVGAAKAVQLPEFDRPVIGMTSLGSSCLKYMKRLKPALEERGFEVAIFHTTGMGGMAFEKMAAEGAFACVMDFSLQEFANLQAGSLVNSGDDRLTNANKSGTPQMIAPGATDIMDLAGWQDVPEALNDRPFHSHNRLIKSAGFSAEERRRMMRKLAELFAGMTTKSHFFLPLKGVEEWDREGQDAHNPEALAAQIDEARACLPSVIDVTEVDAHINDHAFSDAVLALFDQWVADGIVKTSNA